MRVEYGEEGHLYGVGHVIPSAVVEPARIMGIFREPADCRDGVVNAPCRLVFDGLGDAVDIVLVGLDFKYPRVRARVDRHLVHHQTYRHLERIGGVPDGDVFQFDLEFFALLSRLDGGALVHPDV